MGNIIDHAMDYQAAEHWVKAVGDRMSPSVVLNDGNILDYAKRFNIWFTPDYDEDGIIQNDRLEQFRLACLYDCLSNALDVGINLDDEIKPTLEWLRLLTQHAGTGTPSSLEWMTPPESIYSIVLRTLRFES